MSLTALPSLVPVLPIQKYWRLVAFALLAALPAVGAVAVTTTALPVGVVGGTYGPKTLVATGGATSVYTWSLASGSLTGTGITLSTTGVLSGRPLLATTLSL